jgi:hypothetical protein
MAFFAGFDTRDYPGIDVMDWLNSNTNMVWCGYYLAPAPNRSPTGWPNQYTALKAKWGVAPIYVGQQDARTGTNTYTPSSILTSEQGTIDGKDAADLMAADHFPAGAYVYLDWEYGGLDGQGSSDYIKAWISAVVDDGRAMPGVYCSHVVAQGIVNIIDTINPTPSARLWCWKVLTADSHPFQGDLSNIPELNPSGCGFAGAVAWQREQNAVVTFPDGAPITSLTMDFSTSDMSNPDAPSGVA